MIKISTIIICILFATALHAQVGYWQQLHGPTGGFSEAMVAGPDGTIYLATAGLELWKRSPGSTGWTKSWPLPFDLNGTPAQPFFFADGKMFLMDNVSGAAVSTDDGKSWTMSNIRFWGMTVMNGTLYGITSDAILRSTDSGASWKTVLQDSDFWFANITADPSGKIYADGFNAAGGGDIYTNVQRDSVWQKVSTPNVNEWDFILAVGDSICIAVPKDGYGRKLFRTTNGGIEWDTIADLGYDSPIIKDSSGLLYACGSPIMVSSDSGATWTNSQFPSDINGSVLCVTPTNEIYARTEQHIYDYSRSTQHWSLWEDSLYCSNIYAIMPFSDDSIIVACNQGYYRTGDGGNSWAKDSMDKNVVFGSSVTVEVPYSWLLRDREGYLYSGQLRYDPTAAEWENLVYIIDSVAPGFVDFTNPTVLAVDSSGYVLAYDPDNSDEIFRSSDHGITWDSVSDSPNGWGLMAVDPQGRIVSATGTVIVRSADHGETWNTLASGFSPHAIVVTQNGTILAEDEGSDAQGYYYMIESTDDGATWQVNRQFQPLAFALDGSNKLYAAGAVWYAPGGMGIMISTDTGKTGEIISQSIDTAFDFVAVSPNHTLYAGTTADGIFRYVPGASSVETTISSPDNFTIFPNPATNEIQITLSEGNISILDPLGRSYEVKQTGNTLDVSSLPSGVYFVSDGQMRAKFVKE